jgi:hypothetical protein
MHAGGVEDSPSIRDWRSSPLWLVAPAITLLLSVPVLRHAAKLDRSWFDENHFRVREHAGSFLAYGLAVCSPSVLAALVSRRARIYGSVAAIVTLAMAGVCEAFVSFTTW